MRKDLVELLACPVDKHELRLEVDETENDEVLTGRLVCTHCGHAYKILEGIPRMLTPELERELGLSGE